MKTYLKIIGILLIGILSFCVGYFLTDIYIKPDYEGESVIGVWARIRTGELKGSWVSFRVEDMSVDQMLTTCYHEVGHEIYYRNISRVSTWIWDNNKSEDFAIAYEDNYDKCLECLK